MKAKLFLAATLMLALSVGSANAATTTPDSNAPAMHASHHNGNQPKKHRHHRKHHRHHKMMKH